MDLIYSLEQVYYFLKYDILKHPLEIPENFNKDIFNHSLKVYQTDEGFIVESKDHPGLYAAGTTLEEARDAFHDTLLTYFDIPRYFARRIPDKFRIVMNDGKVIKAKSSANDYNYVGV